MPIWDHTTMAVTMRCTGTASTSSPSDPVFAMPIPTAARARASSQSGTSAAIPAREVPATASSTAAKTSGRGRRAAGRGRAGRDDQGGADVEPSDLRLAEALGEVERKYALEHAEGEHREEDRGRGDPESSRSQHSAIGREPAPCFRLADQEDEWQCRYEEREVGEEGAADAAEGAERRSDQPADRVGGKDAAHAQVLLAGPALEGVEGDPDPDPAGPEAHQETGGEVDRERVAEHEAERPDGDQDEGADEQGPGAAATDDRAGEGEPHDHARRERGDEQPDGGGAGAGGVRDRGGDRDDHAVAGGVERAEREQQRVGRPGPARRRHRVSPVSAAWACGRG